MCYRGRVGCHLPPPIGPESVRESLPPMHFLLCQQDYYPHVITNDGLHFLKTSKRLDPSPPVMMVLSYPAPHGPEDSAPEHAHRYFNASDHQ